MFLISSFSLYFWFFIKGGATPLFVAAQSGHEQIVQILLEKGEANIDLPKEVFYFNLIF